MPGNKSAVAMLRRGSSDPPTAPARATSRSRGSGPAKRLLLLPTLNEEEGLETTLQEFESVYRRLDGGPAILVVDGHSQDRTEEVARGHHATFLLQNGKGKGAAVRHGLEWAYEHGFDAVGVIDADGTYPCSRLPAMFGLLEDGTDVVVGVRRPDHPPSASPRDLVHRVGNVALNLCAAQFSGGPLLDVCSGFWGVRAEIVHGLALESDGFEVESELFVKAFRRKLKVVQIPVEYRQRVGTAKLRAVRDGSRILLSILRHSVVPRSAGSTSNSPPNRPFPAPTAPISAGVPLRDLESVVLTLNPAQLLVVTPPEHLGEAAAMAHTLEARRPGLETVTTTTSATVSQLSEDETELVGGPAPVVVTLPDGPWDSKASGDVVVDIPRSRRVVCMRPANEPRRGPFDFLERSLVRGPGLWALVGATLDPSGVQKELMLLRANASNSSLDVFRTRRRPRRRAPSGDPSRVERALRLIQRW